MALAFVVAGAAGAAQADTIITATYHGTITLLQDTQGLLGQEIDVFGTAPAGLTFTDVFKFDLEDGTRITTPVSGNAADNLLGGSAFGGAAPLISSTFTVGGVSFDFLGTFASQQFTEQGNVASSAAEVIDDTHWRINEIAINTNAPALLTTDFSGLAAGPASGAVIICPVVDGNCTPGFQAELMASDVTVSITNSVPEPASWALMIAGFGLAGAGLRRRRRAVAAG